MRASTALSSDPLLGRADWIQAAFRILIVDGIEAVKIMSLAKTLGVTRGSFYWHFGDRDDLLDALFQRWETTNTQGIIDALSRSYDLTAGILALFDCWIDIEGFDARLDSAIRDWARRDARVRDAVRAADNARIQALTEFYERNGFAPSDAFIRARILYHAQVGYYALHPRESLHDRIGYLEAYFRGFTGQDLDPDVAAAFKKRHLKLAEEESTNRNAKP